MIKAYAVGIKLECNGVTCLDYVNFYSKRSDAKTDIEEHRKTGEKKAFIIPIDIREKYEFEKKEEQEEESMIQPLIKNINSNLIRAQRAEEDITRIKYLTEVVNGAMFFSLMLKNRGDFKHSKEYVETALSVNRVITNMLRRAHDLISTLYYSEKEEG